LVVPPVKAGAGGVVAEAFDDTVGFGMTTDDVTDATTKLELFLAVEVEAEVKVETVTGRVFTKSTVDVDAKVSTPPGPIHCFPF
jgi:hypothetical protein